jgi:hypothetical protein
MTKKKLSRSQKRKKKLQKRGSGQPRRSLAYHGNKYKNEKHIMAMMRAETGILECYVMTDRQLTDGEVKAALIQLIGDLRRRGYQPAELLEVVTVEPETYVDLVIWNIRRNWDDLFGEQPRHSNADLVGILRTILSSVETWATPSPDSQGYLNYIEGFLAQGGIQPQLVATDEEWEEEPAPPSDQETLLDLGKIWLETDSSWVRDRFFRQGREMIEAGQADAVINTCQWLIGQRNEEAFVDELRPLLQPAYRQLGVPYGEGPRSVSKKLFKGNS